MRSPRTSVLTRLFAAAAAAAVLLGGVVPLVQAQGKEIELLNVSYDPTRELWKELNQAFIADYEKQSGNKLGIKMSHGGSGSQARAVVDGLEADVVTLAMWPDTDAVRKSGLIANGWEERLPNSSVAYESTIVFVVRRGNPKGIKDWPDLAKPGIEIVTPNPKTSGNGKLSLLAAWGSVTERGGTEEQARELVIKMYKQAPVLDPAARGSTTTFAKKKIGDVHLTWENEAHLELAEFPGQLEIVYPPISFRAEPPLAWVDANVKRKGTAEVAKAYLDFLYTPAGQEIIAKNYYRPTDPQVLEKNRDTFPEMTLFPITAVAKDWNDAYARFFSEGGIFDQIYAAGRK
jgi:sulfate/thiosulfate-binding protein